MWSCSVRNSEVLLYLEDMVYFHTLQPEILVDSNFVVWYAGANADISKGGANYYFTSLVAIYFSETGNICPVKV